MERHSRSSIPSAGLVSLQEIEGRRRGSGAKKKGGGKKGGGKRGSAIPEELEGLSEEDEVPAAEQGGMAGLLEVSVRSQKSKTRRHSVDLSFRERPSVVTHDSLSWAAIGH